MKKAVLEIEHEHAEIDIDDDEDELDQIDENILTDAWISFSIFLILTLTL